MRTFPTISVIINCYNSERYLQEAIDSVYAQTFQDWEIIFFDNCSTDGSANIAKSYDSRLRYFKNNETVLLGNARNLAIGKARGKFIAFLDCDDRWLPEKLELQFNALNQPSERPIGLCYTDAMRIDSTGRDLLAYSHEKSLPSGNVYKQLIYSPFIACSAAMVKTSVLKEVGGFSPQYHYVEEWDVWLKIASQYNIVCINQRLTHIRIHSDNLSKDIDAQYKERIRLAKSVLARDPSMRSYCKRSIQASFFQYKLSCLFLKRSYPQKFFDASCLLLRSMLAPFVTIGIIKKYLNAGVYSAFKKKYLSRDAHSIED